MTAPTPEDVAREVAEALGKIDTDRAAEFMKPCPRCDSRGYHHGFGEHGHDPDWCSECDGSGTVFDTSAHAAEQDRVIAAALRAARAAAIEEAARVADAEREEAQKSAANGTISKGDCVLVAVTAREIATAIRALGEESARGEPHGGCPK